MFNPGPLFPVRGGGKLGCTIHSSSETGWECVRVGTRFLWSETRLLLLDSEMPGNSKAGCLDLRNRLEPC